MRAQPAGGVGTWLVLVALLVLACGPATSGGAAAPAKPAAASGSGAAPAPASSSAGAPAAAPTERLRVAWVSVSGGYLPLWVAQDAGLFRQRGLETELLYTNGAQAVQSLLAREVDVAYTDGSAIVRAALSGGDTVILGSTTPTFPFKVIANPALRQPADLRGKRLGITRAGTTTDFAARYLLKDLGLLPDADVALIQTGGTPEMLEAMMAGGIDAGLMSEPTALVGIKQGYVNLKDLSTLGVEYPVTGIGVLRPLVTERPKALAAFVGGLVDSIAWIHGHREEATAILGNFTHLDDQESLAATYDEYVPRFPRVPYATEAGVTTILESIRDVEPKAAEARPSDFLDDRFVRELDESGYIRRLYAQ